MFKIFIYKFTNKTYKLQPFFSKYRKSKIRLSSNQEYINQNIETEYIVYHLFNKLFGIESLDFEVVGVGRPIVKDNPFHFNIAHSKDYLVVAISDKNISIDIEHINPRHLKIKKRLYNEKVKYDIDRVIKDFTIKEAFVKYFASTVTTNLKSISIQEETVQNEKYQLYYQSFKFLDEYYISVCTTINDVFELEIIESIEKIFDL